MSKVLSSYWKDFLDLLFPRCCAACENVLVGNEELLCTTCRVTLPRIETDSILRATLAGKFAGYPIVKEIYAYLAFTKKGKVQNLLHALKYRKQPEVGRMLGRMLAQELIVNQRFPVADVVVSVPLHRKKLKERGYNQSDAFAQGLSDVTDIPWSGAVLIRTRYTSSQTGKSKTERRQNVEGIFKVSTGTELRGKKVILVDDVLTTGATLEACVEVLIEAGCSELYIMTLAAAQQ
jgi:ComF family protein